MSGEIHIEVNEDETAQHARARTWSSSPAAEKEAYAERATTHQRRCLEVRGAPPRESIPDDVGPSAQRALKRHRFDKGVDVMNTHRAWSTPLSVMTLNSPLQTELVITDTSDEVIAKECDKLISYDPAIYKNKSHGGIDKTCTTRWGGLCPARCAPGTHAPSIISAENMSVICTAENIPAGTFISLHVGDTRVFYMLLSKTQQPAHLIVLLTYLHSCDDGVDSVMGHRKEDIPPEIQRAHQVLCAPSKTPTARRV